MRVSFLVTYYNQEKYVQQSLDSILRIKKPFEWEILIGDDGSIDGTVMEVQKYMELYPGRMRLFVMTRERGKRYDPVKRASENRINLLEKSTGDYFCFLDGDDFFGDTEFVKDAMGIFCQYKEVSVVAFGYKTFGGSTVEERASMMEEEVLLPMNGLIDTSTYLERFYLHAGSCIHKKCFGSKRIEYIKQLGYFDDNNIMVNSLNYGRMFVVSRPVYSYRQTGTGIYSGMDRMEQAVLNVLGMDVDLRLISAEQRNPILKRYECAVALMYIYRNRLRKILGEYKYSMYENGCAGLESSYCGYLLHFDHLRKEQKKELIRSLHIGKKCLIMQRIKYILSGIHK